MKELFKSDILNSIIWFNVNCGEYIYYKYKIYEQYKDYFTPAEIDKMINELIKDDYIVKKIKRVIYNNRFSTKVTFKIK